ncbi:hypothetical protein BDA96_10G147500 [Sorghum bicolor]|uniref:Uncharacterized protein n=2 Tax=Sorghum bicolor TaxID=4558 RepID=A0A921U106_SORBI|nr:hypothetical protein BDA96_10G147500 [Sorghum bicolor]KAG0513955.1 hypothetical protein BDA96_10G147500 [Sorghum bicolor]KXG19809.1 hypothetical protein SORBI_3010G119700 [Sorghum bicolor]
MFTNKNRQSYNHYELKYVKCRTSSRQVTTISKFSKGISVFISELIRHYELNLQHGDHKKVSKFSYSFFHSIIEPSGK